MEKPTLKTFDSTVLATLWDEWAVGQNSELFDRYRNGYERLQTLSKEDLLLLADRALGQALHEDAGSFLLLAMFAVQAAGINLRDIPAFHQVPSPDKELLVKRISTQIASMTIVENPALLESTDIPDGATYVLQKKLDRLSQFERHPNLLQDVAGHLLNQGLYQLDRDAYVRVLNEKRQLGALIFLLGDLTCDELLSLAIDPLVMQSPLLLALLWKLTRPPFSFTEHPPAMAIGAVLDQIMRDFPAIYGQVVSYFHQQPLFVSGMAMHISRLDTLSDMVIALDPLPMERSPLAGAPPHPLDRQYLALEPPNTSLYQQTIYGKWQAWCREQIPDPNRSIYYLALSGFEESLEAYFRTCLSRTELEQQAMTDLQQLVALDLVFFETRPTQSKTLLVLLTRLQFIGKALQIYPDRHEGLTQIAIGLLEDPIWRGRHLDSAVQPEVSKKTLERFIQSSTPGSAKA